MRILKKISFSSIFLSLIFLVSCSAEEKKIKKISKTKIIVKTNEVSANRLLTAEVEGMVCKMGCGSSIRKELISTNAVESCEIDYQDNRKQNFVKVAFDEDKITEKKIVSIINTMNEKQFKVGKVETSKLEKEVKTSPKKQVKQEKVETSNLDEEEVEIKVSETDIETPNLLQLFSKVVTG
ncbi:MAG: hypothetical protein V4622_14405 [Bacteroidota bacterium]